MSAKTKKKRRVKVAKQGGWANAWVNETRGWHGRWVAGGSGPAAESAAAHHQQTVQQGRAALAGAGGGGGGGVPGSEGHESPARQSQERAMRAQAHQELQEVKEIDQQIAQLRQQLAQLRGTATTATSAAAGTAAGATTASGNVSSQLASQQASTSSGSTQSQQSFNQWLQQTQAQEAAIEQQIDQLQARARNLRARANRLLQQSKTIQTEASKENRVPVAEKAATLTGIGEVTYVSFPIQKTETTPEGDLVVYGKATDGSVDSDEQIVDPKFSADAIRKWLATGPNVRVQHNPQRDPAGVGIEMDTDREGATWVKSLIVEPVAKRLVEKGALRAYSVGIARPTIVRDALARGGRITSGEIVEISLVDRPANKNCGIQLVKAGSDGAPEYVGKIFGSADVLTKYAGSETVTVELPADVNISFTPNDLAKTLNRRYGTNAVTQKRDFDPDVGGGVDRDKLPASDFAGRDRSFPIVKPGDVSDALMSIGRAGPDNYSHARLRRNILRIARRKGFPVPKSDRKTDKGAKEPYGSVTYADPGYQKDGVKRYPLDTETHIRAAWSYINMPRNAKKYSPGDLKKVKSRIRAAMRRIGAQVENSKSLNARLSKAEAFATMLMRKDQADARVTAALHDLRTALDTAVQAQGADPDNATDPVDAEVWAHLEDLENALREATRDQAKDVDNDAAGKSRKKPKVPRVMESDLTKKKKKIICPGCGAKQNSAHSMCAECGSALKGAVPLRKNHDYVCLGCGKELDKGEQYCPGCGKENPGYLPEADRKIPANKSSGSGVTGSVEDIAHEMLESATGLPEGDPQMRAAMRLKSAGAPRDLGVLHDLTCPAYKWDDVLEAHPDANFAAMELAQWQAKALDAAANGSLESATGYSRLWQHAVTLKGTAVTALREAKDDLNKAFQDANPGPSRFPKPGELHATQFRRPLLQEGHETPSPEHEGPNRAQVPTESISASEYDRGYISAGHATENAGHGHAPERAVSAPRFTGVPERVDYSAVKESNARQAMIALHDHLAQTFPDLCPMDLTPSTPGPGHTPAAIKGDKAFPDAAPAFDGWNPSKDKKGKKKAVKKLKAAEKKAAKAKKALIKAKKKSKKAKLPEVSAVTMSKPSKLPKPTAKPGFSKKQQKKLKVKITRELKRDAQRNGELKNKALMRAARKAAKRSAKRSLQGAMQSQTEAARSGEALPSAAPVNEKKPNVKRVARKAARAALAQTLGVQKQAYQLDYFRETPPSGPVSSHADQPDLAAELKKSRRELKKKFAAQQKMIAKVSAQKAHGGAPEVDVTPLREASAALATELRRSRKEFARFKAERKMLEAAAAIQPAAETASPEIAEAAQQIQQGNARLAAELRKSRRELNKGFQRQQRMFRATLSEQRSQREGFPELPPSVPEAVNKNQTANQFKQVKKASASQIREASAGLAAELRKTRKELNSKFKAQRDRLDDLSRQPDYDQVVHEMQLKVAGTEARKASEDAAAELRQLRSQLTLLAARGQQQPHYVPIPPLGGNGGSMGPEDRIVAELRKMRKESARKDAQLKKFKAKAQKAYKIADQLAGQPDPALAPFRGIAQNVFKSAAAPARPADVQTVADYAERTQAMMLHELDKQFRTSADPAAREAAWRAISKMRGIPDDKPPSA